MDKNEDRALSYGEGLKWILDYGDEATVGDTEQLKKRYYRRTARATAIGEGHDVTDNTQPILWPGFLAACKEAGVKDEDPLVARDKLEEWAPPGFYPPKFGNEPPSSEGIDDSKEFTRFVLEELTPWYEWATSDEEGRPCRNLIDEEFPYTRSSWSWDLQGMAHKDGDGQLCGKVELPARTDYDGWTFKGYMFFWKG